MISSIRHKQSISWTFLSDAMAISAKEMPKNHTDKERFAVSLYHVSDLQVDSFVETERSAYRKVAVEYSSEKQLL